MSEMKKNNHGGLTLVPMPGFVPMAELVKKILEEKYSDTSVDIAVPQFGLRASGEPFVLFSKEHVGGHDCVVITSGPGTYMMLGQLYLTLEYLVGRRASRIAVISGYLPLTRSDKDEGVSELALVSHVVYMMEAAAHGNLDRIIVVDLHAQQEVCMGSRMGLITEVSLAGRLLRKVIEAGQKFPELPLCLLFPDEGAIKRFEKAVEDIFKEINLSLPIVCGQKRRSDSWQSKCMGFVGEIEKLKGALVIGFDDEVATLGTNVRTAEEVLNKYGATKYFAVAIHGVLCGKALEILEQKDCPISQLYTTNTIIHPLSLATTNDEQNLYKKLIHDQKIIIVDWSKDLAHIVYNHHWDNEIRERR